MFTVQIVKFEKTLFDLSRQLERVNQNVQTLNSKVDGLTQFLLKTQDDKVKSWKQFEACAKGFAQIKEACECLREELAAAAGTMIDNSWAEYVNTDRENEIL